MKTSLSDIVCVLLLTFSMSGQVIAETAPASDSSATSNIPVSATPEKTQWLPRDNDLRILEVKVQSYKFEDFVPAYQYQDVVLLRQFITGSNAEDAHKRVLNNKLDSLIDLCEQSTCRRQTLLGYFGEELKDPCGNCDNCLNPPEQMDVTDAAQKALSAVHRTEQGFGMMYLIDVLTGKDDERIKKNGHDKLNVFGIGKDHTLFAKVAGKVSFTTKGALKRRLVHVLPS